LLVALSSALSLPAGAQGLKQVRTELHAKLDQVDKAYHQKDEDLLHAYQQAMDRLNRERLPRSEAYRRSEEVQRRYKEQSSALYNMWQKERRYWMNELKRLDEAEAEAGNRIKRKIRELNEAEQKEIEKVLKDFESRRKRAMKRRDQKELARIIGEQAQAVNEIDQRYKRQIAALQSREKREELAVAIFRQGSPAGTVAVLNPKKGGAARPSLRPGVGLPKVERRHRRPPPSVAVLEPGRARIAIPHHAPPLGAVGKPSKEPKGEVPGQGREHVKGPQPGTARVGPPGQISAAGPRSGGRSGRPPETAEGTGLPPQSGEETGPSLQQQGESIPQQTSTGPTEETHPAQPLTIATEPLVMTGLGRREIETEPLRMTGLGRREITTEALRMTGLGRREIQTEPLVMTGLGRRLIETAPLVMTGLGRREILTAPLKMTGLGRRVIRTEALKMTGFGLENPEEGGKR